MHFWGKKTRHIGKERTRIWCLLLMRLWALGLLQLVQEFNQLDPKTLALEFQTGCWINCRCGRDSQGGNNKSSSAMCCLQYPDTTHGTARTDCRESARGGARGWCLGRQSYGSPMERLGDVECRRITLDRWRPCEASPIQNCLGGTGHKDECRVLSCYGTYL